MKKFWLSVAVGAVAALAVQAGSTQFADPDPVDPWKNNETPVLANNNIVDPWSGTPAA